MLYLFVQTKQEHFKMKITFVVCLTLAALAQASSGVQELKPDRSAGGGLSLGEGLSNDGAVRLLEDSFPFEGGLPFEFSNDEINGGTHDFDW